MQLTDGDQLYSGTRQLIADHLDHLAATLIVPSFPRTDPYASTSGGSALANGGLGSGMNGEGPSRTSARSGTTGGGATKGSSQAVERVIEGDVFLKSVKGVWEDHTTSMQKVQVILRYMVSPIVSISHWHALVRITFLKLRNVWST